MKGERFRSYNKNPDETGLVSINEEKFRYGTKNYVQNRNIPSKGVLFR